MMSKRTATAKRTAANARPQPPHPGLVRDHSRSNHNPASIFQHLVLAEVIPMEGHPGRGIPVYDVVELENVRKSTRNYLALPVPIYEKDNPRAKGTLLDLTEEGLQIEGIAARKDEIKEFLVNADKFNDIRPFSFRARCLWARNGSNGKRPLAGFKIVGISEKAMRELRKIIWEMTLSEP